MIGRVFVLLLLVAVLAAGGIVWFDYLNVIDAKAVMAPIYGLFGRQARTQPRTTPDEFLNLDAERLAIRLEVLELERMELERSRRELVSFHGEIEQMAQELEERQKALDDRENSLRAQITDAENRDRNVEEFARILTGMPPDRAVGIMTAMDDQDIINVLRKTEELAQAEGAMSIVPFWLSLMEPIRAADLQRKMAGRPQSF